MLLTPSAMLAASLALVIAEALVDKPGGISMSYFPRVARTGVLAMLACITAGVVSAVISLVRGERPRSLPLLGLVTNSFLVGVFWYLELYKLGFGQ